MSGAVTLIVYAINHRDNIIGMYIIPTVFKEDSNFSLSLAIKHFWINELLHSGNNEKIAQSISVLFGIVVSTHVLI